MEHGAWRGRQGNNQGNYTQRANVNINMQHAFYPSGVNRTSLTGEGSQYWNNAYVHTHFSPSHHPCGPPSYQYNIQGPALAARTRPPAAYVTPPSAPSAMAPNVSRETATGDYLQPVKMDSKALISTSTAQPQSDTIPCCPPEVSAEGAGSSGNPSEPYTDGEVKKPGWMTGGKVCKAVRKRRQNARLRKIIQPKHPFVVLTELRPSIKFSFVGKKGPLNQTVFNASVEVDGKTYTGLGSSKQVAKQNASESALRCVLLEQMRSAASSGKKTDYSGASSEIIYSVDPEIDADVDQSGKIGNNEGSTEQNKQCIPEDNTPWGSLASYAIYRLFSDWQNRGIELPAAVQSPVPEIVDTDFLEVHRVKEGTFPKGPFPLPMKRLPHDAKDRPPLMLLNQMHPGTQFVDIAVEGKPPNTLFIVGVTVDGMNFTGEGRSKKLAKNAAAKNALTDLHHIQY